MLLEARWIRYSGEYTFLHVYLCFLWNLRWDDVEENLTEYLT